MFEEMTTCFDRDNLHQPNIVHVNTMKIGYKKICYNGAVIIAAFAERERERERKKESGIQLPLHSIHVHSWKIEWIRLKALRFIKGQSGINKPQLWTSNQCNDVLNKR